jgi:hypothetical protein
VASQRHGCRLVFESVALRQLIAQSPLHARFTRPESFNFNDYYKYAQTKQKLLMKSVSQVPSSLG